MRTRTLITGAAFLVVGVASAGRAQAQLNLRGSDTLDLVTTDTITACTGANGLITYVGGGSGAGEAAMLSGTQHVAPMSSQLNSGATGGGCTANARQLLVGLDGLAVVAKNAKHSSTCTDDIGGTASTGGPLVLTGIPSTFIACTSNTVCNNAFAGATCDTVRQFCQVSGALTGCTAAQGCSPDGTYTFDNGTAGAGDDWKDVINLIYGGMNHTTAPTQITDATEVNADGTAICFTPITTATTTACNATTPCVAGQYCDFGICKSQVADVTKPRNCKRNPARIDCASPVRGVLLASYGSIIRNPSCTLNVTTQTCAMTSDCPTGQTCNTTLGVCELTECVKLKHAFRRDDLSGTTDAFISLTGLPKLAGQTKLRSTAGGGNAPEVADFAAVAGTFCNSGTAALNKGFGDGLDLDPIRRACNVGPAPDRVAFEEVCEAGLVPTNSDVACYTVGGVTVTPATFSQRDRSSPQGRGVLPGGTTDTQSVWAGEFAAGATKPRCLGVVLPISIPQELAGGTVWAAERYPGGGTCVAGVRAFVNPLPARAILCPDGSQKAGGGNCRLAVAASGRFDCVTDSSLQPGATPDPRVFNLAPVNNLGNMAALLDSYQNPNFPGINGIRRFARRYFGLHMVRPDSSKKQATTTAACTFDNDTQQIGCLVKASPCSIGYAGREAADTGVGGASIDNLALTLVGIPPTTTNIQNLANGGTPVYPMARKLWFNSTNFDSAAVEHVGFTQPALTDAELALSNCMGLGGDTSIIDPIIQLHNFVQVPSGVTRLNVCPAM